MAPTAPPTPASCGARIGTCLCPQPCLLRLRIPAHFPRATAIRDGGMHLPVKRLASCRRRTRGHGRFDMCWYKGCTATLTKPRSLLRQKLSRPSLPYCVHPSVTTRLSWHHGRTRLRRLGGLHHQRPYDRQLFAALAKPPRLDARAMAVAPAGHACAGLP